MSFFSVWVDADSCPTPVRQIIFRFCTRLNLKLFFVANRKISMPHRDDFKMIVVESSKDAADNYIVENVQCGDIVITRDIPMANRLVEKNIIVINDRGVLYTKENIKERLSLRNFNQSLYESGLLSEKNSSLKSKDVKNFANCFDRELQKKLKKQ